MHEAGAHLTHVILVSQGHWWHLTGGTKAPGIKMGGIWHVLLLRGSSPTHAANASRSKSNGSLRGPCNSDCEYSHDSQWFPPTEPERHSGYAVGSTISLCYARRRPYFISETIAGVAAWRTSVLCLNWAEEKRAAAMPARILLQWHLNNPRLINSKKVMAKIDTFICSIPS